jgi:hypothetical protein
MAPEVSVHDPLASNAWWSKATDLMARILKREKKKKPGSHNPLQGHVHDNIKPPTRPHLLKVHHFTIVRLETKPLTSAFGNT